jgi:hypothetical protein
MGTPLIRNSGRLGPYSRTVPRAMWHFQRGGQFLKSEVPLYMAAVLVVINVAIHDCRYRLIVRGGTRGLR